MKMDEKNIKAQQEIAGFALIIVIVCIIGVIFLGLSIRHDDKGKTSAEISDFISASMYYTTDCATGYVPNYKELKDLIKSCYRGEMCLDQRKACTVLNETYSGLISKSFMVKEDSKNKAYTLNIYFQDSKEDSPIEPLLEINEGIFSNCTSKAGASQPIFMNSGNLNVEIEFCYG
jgi:hypothetical protein